MKFINNYIQEKLVISKNIKPNINKDTTIYKGIHIGFDNEKSIEKFAKYGPVELHFAYQILYELIDEFEQDLQGYRMDLSYKSMGMFTFYKEGHLETPLGFLYFRKDRCSFSESLECPTSDKSLSQRIYDFVNFNPSFYKYTN